MNKLTIVNKNGQLLVDSREVAGMVEREHKEILTMIEGQKHGDGRVKHIGFLPTISESGLFNPQDFFIKSDYKVQGNNKTYPCYLLTKKGCDMVANKMTGAKGVLFTAEYVTQFEVMEEQLKKNVRELTQKQLLVLDIYEGGSNAIVAHKALSKMEVAEATRKLRDGNNKIIAGSTLVDLIYIEGLTTTLLNEWFCENNFGEMKKLKHEKKRFFSPNERFTKYVAYEGYSLTGETVKKDKIKVIYSTEMASRLLERHRESLVNFVRVRKKIRI
jgi:phage regulator Rha-like protein